MLRRALALMTVLACAPLVRAQAPEAPAQPGDPSGTDPSETVSPMPADAARDDAATREIEKLRAIEAKLAAGASLSDEERALPVALTTTGASARSRALAAAVCAWLDPAGATPALASAAADKDGLVRLTALQSLVSLARRLGDDDRQKALHAALIALDDADDEVSCAALEVVQVLAPSAVADAVRVRASAASELRYGCFARTGALPARTVETPPLPTDERAPTPGADEAPPSVQPPPADEVAADATWLLVAIGATTGAVAGGALPGGFVLSRDILTYTPDRSRLVHEEISFAAQLLGAATGAVVGGGAMFGIAQLSPPTLGDATTVALSAGSGLLLGGSLQLLLALEDAPAVFSFSGASAGGLAVGAALAAFSSLDANDHALALSLAGGGALLSALAVFTAVPVGFDQIGDAYRTDFALGVAGASASALALVGLGAGLLVDVPARRSVAALATGLAGAGLFGGFAFLLIPQSLDVKSRVACGIALGGQLIGTTLGALLLPDALFSDAPAPGTALHLDLGGDVGDDRDGAGRDRARRAVRVGVPTIAPIVDPRGQGIGAALVSGTF